MSFPYLAVSNEAVAPAAPLVRVNQKVLQVANEAASLRAWGSSMSIAGDLTQPPPLPSGTLWLSGLPFAGEWVPPPPLPANMICLNQHPHSDLAIGLTEFAVGKTIAEENVGGGDAWLATHLALCNGRPPVFEDCVRWVFAREDRWRRIAADPLASDFWHDTPKPWQCLAAIFEWVAFLDAGYGFVSHLPVSVDARLIPTKLEEGPQREVCIDESRAEMLAYAALITIMDEGMTVIGVAPGAYATHARDGHLLAGWLADGLDFADREAAKQREAAPAMALVG